MSSRMISGRARMTDRLVVDLGTDGTVSVGAPAGNGAGRAPQAMTWPLSEDVLEDLRWYLEDFLQVPFGVYEGRGAQVAARLPQWGEAVFDAVFGSGPAGAAYQQALARQRPVEVVFRSESAELLALPWELIRDPARPAALALDLAGVSRSLSAIGLADTVAVPRGRLRVLMAICRPAGLADPGYRLIARPLLEQLESAQADIDLAVLRPPTFAALEETLLAAARAGEPFHVVHFDGHGAVTRTPDGEGALAFESPGGRRDLVPASRVAEAVAAGRVPVVVLNACRSAALGRDLGAPVATRLLQAGAVSVVAMAYSVYTVAAAEFMTAFYERLFAGDVAGAAVTAGRLRMSQHNLRPSPKGDMPLADWLVPVHYFRHDVSFPQASAPAGADHGRLTAEEPRPAADAQPGDLAADGAFVGRDELFSRLEAEVPLHNVVVLHGPAGTGKTELAKAFGRWWRDTRGVQDRRWVFWHRFTPAEAPATLDTVLAEIGMQLFGDTQGTAGHAKVLDALAKQKMLLIWDDFDSVRSLADPGQQDAPLRDARAEELRAFIARLTAAAGSSLLITSRTREDWLGDVRRIEVGALSPREATEYAGELLAGRPGATPRRARRAFAELMEWMAGNPLSMRLILPLLSTTEPEALLDGLRGSTPLPAGEHADGSRTGSLAASITYSLLHLAPAVRRLLPAISLFQGVADAGILVRFSQAPQAPVRFRATADQWRAALDGAADVGLVTSLGDGRYQIHPALPAYLTAGWRRDEGPGFAAMRDAATGALLAACAALGDRLTGEAFKAGARHALTTTGTHRHTFANLLGYALSRGLWAEALAVAQPLNQFWDTRGLDEEARLWGQRIVRATEGPAGQDAPVHSALGALWLLFTWAAANRQLRRHQLDDAEHTYRRIMAALAAQPASRIQRQHLAGAHHQLGMIAQQRERLSEAREHYLKAVAIRKEIGARRELAETYVHLGTVEEHRGRPRTARRWYARALSIQHEFAALPGMAVTYHQLGVLEHRRRRLAEAERWYLLSLRIQQELGSKPGLALAFQQLGTLALDAGKTGSAQGWYTRALAVMNELGDLAGMAAVYHQLGVAAQVNGQRADAERWYGAALHAATDADDVAGASVTAEALRRLAQSSPQDPSPAQRRSPA
jgi:tetratricopeptide (TPR) repeat protein